MKIDEIKKLINQHQVISFDVFDTLLFRNVYNPTDIFKIMAKELEKKYKISDFYDIRVSSEVESRKYVEAGESTIEDIYSQIAKKIGEKESSFAKELEIECELKFIEANPFMQECFEYALKKNKKVIIISDMYMRKTDIIKLLKQSGYKEVPTYVSCEIKKGKCTGELFNYVREKEEIGDKSWLHIGDNINSDYEMPKKNGIDAYHYKNIREYNRYLVPKTIEESIITAMQCNYLYNGYDVDYWDKFGTLYISPIYFGFTHWLYNITKKLDNLFFLARDSYIIKEIYDLFPKTGIYTNYVYVSRKSVQLPSLLDGSKDVMINTLTSINTVVNKDILLSDLFSQANLNCEEVCSLSMLKYFGFKSFEDVIDEGNYDKAKKLISVYKDNIIQSLKSQHELAIKYLNQEGMEKFDRINIVDIGWAGSVQNAIRKLLKKETNGYYFGTCYSENKEDIFSSMFGYFFDLDKKEEDREAVLNNVMMYELIFSAPHGTTLAYEDNNKVKPILNAEENCEIIEKFQLAAIRIIKKYMNYIEYFEHIDKYFCLNNYQKFIEEKNEEDLIKFNELTNDFVLNSKKRYSYVQKISLDEVKNNPKLFYEERDLSLWKDTFILEGATEEKDKILKDISKYKRKHDSIENLKELRRKIIPFKIRKKLKDFFQKK